MILLLRFLQIYFYCSSADFTDEPKKPPPRLFCDICDIFDAHDTDDCPIQAQEDDGPAPSYHHLERGDSRPYCDTCEGMYGIIDYTAADRT